MLSLENKKVGHRTSSSSSTSVQPVFQFFEYPKIFLSEIYKLPLLQQGTDTGQTKSQMLEFLPRVPAGCDSRVRARSWGTAEPGQYRRWGGWRKARLYSRSANVAACSWTCLKELWVSWHRCWPLCHHPLWGAVSQIHRQEGHLATGVQDQRCFL